MSRHIHAVLGPTRPCRDADATLPELVRLRSRASTRAVLGATPDADERQGFFGRVEDQIDAVCAQLSADAKLRGRHVNAVGFSQGGLFMRGLAQRCAGVQLHTLVTLGSPHGGVTAVPGCPATANGVWCAQMRKLLEGNVNSKLVRNSVVQAQYFRDSHDIDSFLKFSAFLADINNERAAKNETYKQRLSSLARFVMFRFTNDTTVEPRDSAIFSMQNGDDLVPLQQLPLFTEDWLGLRTLAQVRGARTFAVRFGLQTRTCSCLTRLVLHSAVRWSRVMCRACTCSSRSTGSRKMSSRNTLCLAKATATLALPKNSRHSLCTADGWHVGARKALAGAPPCAH